jgi:hypothetical protein
MRRNPIIYLLSLLLLAAIGLVFCGQTITAEPTFTGKLVDILPPAPIGWKRTQRSIAETQEMQKAVGELLNYDDGVFYEYTSGNLRLSVYIAYWTPGKMSSRLVAGHTPDVCWVNAGWQCTEKDELVGRSVDGRLLPTVQTRTFTVNGSNEYVWFWHLLDGHPRSYKSNGRIPWHAMFTDMLQRGLNQRSEQYFIRLSSPQPLDEPVLQPVLNALLRSLPQLEAKN